MLNVGVFFGGRSGEHDVSRCSAASVFEHLDRTEYNVIAIGIDVDGKFYPDINATVQDDEIFGRVLTISKTGEWYFNVHPQDGRLTFVEKSDNRVVNVDIVFPMLHGTFCEDGRLQGLLELAGVPYVGAGVLGSACAMDKDVTKRLLREADIPVVPGLTVRRIDWDESRDFIIEDVVLEYGFPCFVKPANAGSSVGISRIESRSDFVEKVSNAFKYDNKVLIEKAVTAREIEFSVLGNEHPKCSEPGEICPRDHFYSYSAKYVATDGAELIIPAEIPENTLNEMKLTAEKAFNVLCLQVMARIDFFLERETNIFYINEVNTLPGFTSISMYPKLWENTGLQYSDLLDSLIDLALQSYAERMRIHTEVPK